MNFVVAIRDRAVDAYGQPVFVKAVGQAVRSFGDEINNEQSAMYAHPEDYDLYLIGTYDEGTGALTPQSPSMIAIGKDAKSNKE